MNFLFRLIIPWYKIVLELINDKKNKKGKKKKKKKKLIRCEIELTRRYSND